MNISCSVAQNVTSVDGKEDFSDLPPNQRRKRLVAKIDELQTKIGQEQAARDGLMKMKGVYESNSALGDPMSIEGKSGFRIYLENGFTFIYKYRYFIF